MKKCILFTMCLLGAIELVRDRYRLQDKIKDLEADLEFCTDLDVYQMSLMNQKQLANSLTWILNYGWWSKFDHGFGPKSEG